MTSLNGISHVASRHTVAVFSGSEAETETLAKAFEDAFAPFLDLQTPALHASVDPAFDGYGFTMTFNRADAARAQRLKDSVGDVLRETGRFVWEETDTRRSLRRPDEVATVFILAR